MRENEIQLRDENAKTKKQPEFMLFISKNRELVLILGLTLISSSIQIYFALNTWGMITSDEVCQSIEIAHRTVYGYGYVCPEFRTLNTFYPHYAKCRSPIYPMLFVIPLYIGKLFSLNYWTFTIPLIRVFLGINGSLITPSIYCFIKQYTKGKKNYALLSAILVTFSPVIFLMSFRSVTNIALIPWMFFIVASYLKTVKKVSNKNLLEEKNNLILSIKTKNSEEFRIYLKLVFLTLFMGIILYIRFDIILALGAILIFRFPYRKLKVILSHIIGLILGFSFGILVDYLYYNEFTISPVNWFLFNIVDGGGVLFGVNPFNYYFKLIFELKPVFILVSLLFMFYLILIIRSIFQYRRKKKMELEAVKILGGLLFASIFIIIIFSFSKHKEFRFVYSGFIYFHLSITIALAILIEEFIPKLSSASVKTIKKLRVKRGKFLNINIVNILYTAIIFVLILSSAIITTIKVTNIVNWKEGDE